MNPFFQYVLPNIISIIGLIVVLINQYLNRTVVKSNLRFAGTYNCIVQGINSVDSKFLDQNNEMLVYDLELTNFSKKSVGIRYVKVIDPMGAVLQLKTKMDYFNASHPYSPEPLYLFDSKKRFFHPFNPPELEGQVLQSNQSRIFTLAIPKYIDTKNIKVGLVYIPFFIKSSASLFRWHINFKRIPFEISKDFTVSK